MHATRTLDLVVFMVNTTPPDYQGNGDSYNIDRSYICRFTQLKGSLALTLGH